MRILDSGGRRVLAVSTRSDAIGRMLKDTPYESGYDAQIKRHPLCLTPDKAVRVRMGERQTYARYLDWVDFRTTYMKGVTA